MPFEIGKAFNGGAEWVCGSALVFKAMSNPVLTALLMTALALVILYAMYREELKAAGWRRGAKTGFWLLVGISALVFVHYYALQRHLQTAYVSQGVRTVMESIHHSAAVGGGYAVRPGEARMASPTATRPDNVASFEGAEEDTAWRQPPSILLSEAKHASGLGDPLELEEVVLSSMA
jgi:hypothetical protein